MQCATREDAPLEDKVALITGGARRIGGAITRRLHADGMRVAIHCHRSIEAATLLCEALNGVRPASAAVVSADLRDDDCASVLIESSLARFGRLDALVNNAALFYPTPLGRIDRAVLRELLQVNLETPLLLAQAAAQPLRSTRGAIVNIADVHGVRGLSGHSVYCATKAGLIMVTQTLARELAPAVRVNAIAPGAILWPQAGVADQRERAHRLRRTPLGRLGEPADIAAAVLYLLRDASYVTGQLLTVDGGKTA